MDTVPGCRVGPAQSAGAGASACFGMGFGDHSGNRGANERGPSSWHDKEGHGQEAAGGFEPSVAALGHAQDAREAAAWG